MIHHSTTEQNDQDRVALCFMQEPAFIATSTTRSEKQTASAAGAALDSVGCGGTVRWMSVPFAHSL
jgi:hypothetical protein